MRRLGIAGAMTLLIVTFFMTHVVCAAGPTTAQRWEYRVEHCSFDSGTEDQLNKMGAVGWELVQIVNGMGVFKRPVSASAGRSRASEALAERQRIYKLEKEELTQLMRRLFVDVDKSSQESQRLMKAYNTATTAYASATDDNRLELWLSMLEALAAARKADDRASELRGELEWAKEAYVRLFMKEE